MTTTPSFLNRTLAITFTVAKHHQDVSYKALVLDVAGLGFPGTLSDGDPVPDHSERRREPGQDGTRVQERDRGELLAAA